MNTGWKKNFKKKMSSKRKRRRRRNVKTEDTVRVKSGGSKIKRLKTTKSNGSDDDDQDFELKYSKSRKKYKKLKTKRSNELDDHQELESKYSKMRKKYKKLKKNYLKLYKGAHDVVQDGLFGYSQDIADKTINQVPNPENSKLFICIRCCNVLEDEYKTTYQGRDLCDYCNDATIEDCKTCGESFYTHWWDCRSAFVLTSDERRTLSSIGSPSDECYNCFKKRIE